MTFRNFRLLAVTAATVIVLLFTANLAAGKKPNEKPKDAAPLPRPRLPSLAGNSRP